jgi:hypothetical protein
VVERVLIQHCARQQAEREVANAMDGLFLDARAAAD